MNAHHQEAADVYVEDGIIVAVKPNLMVSTFSFNFILFFQPYEPIQSYAKYLYVVINCLVSVGRLVMMLD